MRGVRSMAKSKTCNTCPFVKAHKLEGSPEWLGDVIKAMKVNKYFTHTCHKTDPVADGYIGSKKVIECQGHLRILFNEMDDTPGKGGVYESHQAMAEKYLRTWLGDDEYIRLKLSSLK